MKLIKLNTDHYVIVDNSEIKEGDWYISPSGGIISDHNGTEVLPDGWNKITHSTQPIEQYYGATDGTIPFVYHKIIELPLSEVKELIGEVDVKKWARNQYSSEPNDYEEIYYLGLIKGYNQALEDNKEKKWTDEDLRKAIEFGYQLRCNNRPINSGHNWVKDFIAQSLQLKTEWEVEFIDNKLKLL